MPKVLALAANPRRSPRLRLEREIVEVQRRVIAARATSFKFIVVNSARVDQLGGLLQEHNPDILHFAGHGQVEGLMFETDSGNARMLGAESLHGILKALEGKTRCVVLNSCFTHDLAKVLCRSVDCVVGMYTAINDDDAITFAANFYEALARGKSVVAAYQLGCHHLSDSDVPKLLRRRGKKLTDLVFPPRPELHAQFVLKRNGEPRCSEGYYEIRLTVQNVLDGTLSVFYHLDDEFPRADRFSEIRTEESPDYKNTIHTYRNDEIRAIVWSNWGGEGIRSTLCDALRRSYGNSMTGKIAAAIKKLSRDNRNG